MKNLLKDIERVKEIFPWKKCPIAIERLEEIINSGEAAGYEWRMIAQYLGLYLFELETRFRLNLIEHDYPKPQPKTTTGSKRKRNRRV